LMSEVAKKMNNEPTKRSVIYLTFIVLDNKKNRKRLQDNAFFSPLIGVKSCDEPT
jgi:hypothetical protein